MKINEFYIINNKLKKIIEKLEQIEQINGQLTQTSIKPPTTPQTPLKSPDKAIKGVFVQGTGWTRTGSEK